MDALLLKEYMNLEMVQMPEPEIGAEDILVRVRACGICGSDVHGMDGSTGRRIPPLVMGHEAAGEVAAVGSAVKDLALGDRVTFDSTIYCGNCFYCARGEVNLCDNREVMGVSPGPYRRHGAFAEFVAVPRRIVYRLPDNLGYEQAALIEAVSVAAHAVSLSGPPAASDDLAVVVGSGMIGLLTVQAARAAGYSRVAAIDVDDAKLAMARQLGASETFNSKTVDAPAGVRELTGGRGAALAIECVGATAPIRTAIASVRKGGAVTLVGNFAPSIDLPLQEVVTRQLRLQGSCASCGEYPAAMDLMARGAIQVDPLISAVAPLGEGRSWFDRLYRHEPNLMKVVLRP
ncbi:MAG TPA: galactitol-1-phosphate 5-dehydrogenase [Candidatus Sulfopaludibacter sp.]|jgi:L-iditol 2-dehydrogenase|nr:galactitol-1-phosphate 5-dehydrogenase [Candidatus Sulfopaludibacter sp.]